MDHKNHLAIQIPFSENRKSFLTWYSLTSLSQDILLKYLHLKTLGYLIKMNFSNGVFFPYVPFFLIQCLILRDPVGFSSPLGENIPKVWYAGTLD